MRMRYGISIDSFKRSHKRPFGIRFWLHKFRWLIRMQTVMYTRHSSQNVVHHHFISTTGRVRVPTRGYWTYRNFLLKIRLHASHSTRIKMAIFLSRIIRWKNSIHCDQCQFRRRRIWLWHRVDEWHLTDQFFTFWTAALFCRKINDFMSNKIEQHIRRA